MPRPADSDPARRGGVPIRASDAERERVMDALRDAAAEGRLTFEELADRIEAAGRARTRDELAILTADLPPETAADQAIRAAGSGSTSLARREGRSAVLGDLRQAGPWRVPEHTRFATIFGDVDIDLREAIVPHGLVEIAATSTFGDVTLIVPQGVVVDVRCRTWFGAIRQEAGHEGPPGAPVVLLTGGSRFGDVRVRARRLRDRLGDLLRFRLGA
jgi:hypothetical protein